MLEKDCQRTNASYNGPLPLTNGGHSISIGSPIKPTGTLVVLTPSTKNCFILFKHTIIIHYTNCVYPSPLPDCWFLLSSTALCIWTGARPGVPSRLRSWPITPFTTFTCSLEAEITPPGGSQDFVKTCRDEDNLIIQNQYTILFWGMMNRCEQL